MRNVTPLLAVVALGLGGVASADPMPRTKSVAAIKPRVLRTGAPACANVLDKDNQPLGRTHPDYPTCKPDHPNNPNYQPPGHRVDQTAITAVFASLGLDEDGVERLAVLEHERR
jgi:hypothetical protein